jgi:hypothetical protein
MGGLLAPQVLLAPREVGEFLGPGAEPEVDMHLGQVEARGGQGGRGLRPPRRGVVLAGAAALASALTAAGCGQTPAATGVPVPASAIGRLTAIACHAATINGSRAPAWITAVVTTRAQALTSATPGGSVPGSARVKVFLITMRGRFTVADGPLGAKPLAGQYLSLVLDARTFHGLDFGVSPEAPPVSPASLGPVSHLAGCGH